MRHGKDLSNFLSRKQSNNPSALRVFAKEFNTEPESKEALQLANKIQTEMENLEFQVVFNSGSIKQVREYLSNSPPARFRSKMHLKLIQLSFEEAVKSNDPENLKAFAFKYPSEPETEKAIELAKNLAWHLDRISSLIANNNLCGLKEYLNMYPNSPYRERVQVETTKLERQLEIKAIISSVDEEQSKSKRRLSTEEIAKIGLKSCVLIVTKDGNGSGVLISSNGIILTNWHVIGDRRYIKVISEYGKRINFARFLYGSPEKDIAILSIDVHTSFAILGNPRLLRPGQQVVVVSNPSVGSKILSNTVAQGIVSNPRQEIFGHEWIQIDVSVNPGSSGGPVFNEFGEVVGIVSSSLIDPHLVVSPDLEHGIRFDKINVPKQGLNLAIPIDAAIPYIKKCLNSY